MSTALKTAPTLLQLCAPLNVDVELTDDDIIEMQDKITTLEEQLETAKQEIADFEEADTELTEKIDDFKAWLDGLPETRLKEAHNMQYKGIDDAINEIAIEFYKLFKE